MENKREELGMAEDKPRGSTILMKFPRTKNLKGKKTMKEKNTSNNKAVHWCNFHVIVGLQVSNEDPIGFQRGANIILYIKK